MKEKFAAFLFKRIAQKVEDARIMETEEILDNHLDDLSIYVNELKSLIFDEIKTMEFINWFF